VHRVNSLKCKHRVCLSTVLLSNHPWLLREYPPISISFSWVLGIVACPSCSVWPFHTSKSAFRPSHQMCQKKKKNCPCAICGHMLLNCQFCYCRMGCCQMVCHAFSVLP
jgi:hypothetical protein